MSMEDILKALVDSRQQGSSAQGSGDQMANLIGGLLGGAQSGGTQQSGGDLAGGVMNLLGSVMGGAQQPQGAGQPQAGGLSGMMGMLESVIGGQNVGQNDPIMMMLQPFVTPLANKAKISPEIAMIVVSFVAHKLLAHHPSSGRDSNSFNLDDMLQQIAAGKIDTNMLHSSGMVSELSQKTGLDEATTVQALNTAFSLVGKGAASMIQNNQSRPTAKPSAAGAVKSLGAKGSASPKKN